MARSGNVTYEKVVEAISVLKKENIKPTIRNVRDRIGGGDFNKISKFINLFITEEFKIDGTDICISEELHEKIKSEIRCNVQLARDKDQKAIVNLTCQCSELQELLLRLEQERVEVGSALDALKVEKANNEGAHKMELSLLRERVEESGKTSADLRSQTEKISDQLVRSEKERLELACALDAVKVEKAAAEGAYKTELSLLKDRLESSEKNAADLRSQTEKVSEQLRQLDVSAALAREEANRLRSSLAEAEQLQIKITDENRQLKIVNVGLEKDLNACQIDAKMLKRSQDRSEKQLETQQEEIKQLYLKQERMSAEYSNVRELNARLETKLTELGKNYHQETRRKNRPIATTTTALPPPPTAGTPASP